jgi:hypothetical protein
MFSSIYLLFYNKNVKKMNSVLREWLRVEFYKSNVTKYVKYFDEWIEGITENQINGFEQQRIGQITKNKYV